MGGILFSRRICKDGIPFQRPPIQSLIQATWNMKNQDQTENFSVHFAWPKSFVAHNLRSFRAIFYPDNVHSHLPWPNHVRSVQV